MDHGDPLLIEPIDPTPDSDLPEQTLFDFEKDWRTLGWELEGTAFGDVPMSHSQHGSKGIVGKRYAASFYGYDGGLGTVTSPEFVLGKDYLHFKVAGGSEKEILGVHESSGVTEGVRALRRKLPSLGLNKQIPAADDRGNRGRIYDTDSEAMATSDG